MLSAYRSHDLWRVYTHTTFQALVDAIIPPTLLYGVKVIPGAAQLQIELYVIDELDSSQFIPIDVDSANKPPPLSWATAHLLDTGANQLILRRLQQTGWPSHLSPWGSFASLDRIDRLRTLDLIDRIELPVQWLIPPYRNDPALIQTMMDSLHQLTMFGYYSEWVGYGTTRGFPPTDRRLESFPPGWRVAGYPGVSFGYRDLCGFLLEYPHDKRGMPNE
ncbi:hypothetical protein [Paenibacillus silviterrae]|uniref:hypothetical protein n=1 Tax=Paenibacillus silviterrae TaxID=3242194 RepID=UPI0025427E2A|nr:hypothetical protein [Paenibacillus chinjuensis]